MTLEEAISLINHASKPNNPTHWADLGCGSGLFTLALSHYLARGSTIDAIDLRPTITRQTTSNGVVIRPHKADFTKDPLPFATPDGILMANSLHYVRDKRAFLTRIQHVPTILLVEYDTDRAVPRWVPYPLSYGSAAGLLSSAGWTHIQKLGTRPSAFGRAELYAALATH
jgi:hypothetical protein